MAIDKSKYVVLDIETNGLTIKDDILSISIFKPDDEITYNKFLPLEISKKLSASASAVNGITQKDLENATPLTQQDVYALIKQFELDKRTILIYSEFDKRMLKHYFNRKGLSGFNKFNFYNFKRDVISSRYSEGNITKDNLCALYEIDNIQVTHTSLNDCILEWKLFEKMNGNKLFITNNKVFEMNQEYIIPISYFASHPNLERYVHNFPYINIETQLLKRFDLHGKGILRFETNINGMLIEHLINSMLNVEVQDSLPFLIKNKSKLNYLGELPSKIHEIPLFFKEDGTVNNINLEDDNKVKEFNKSILAMKKQMKPVIEFISYDIFENNKIMSQELVINEKDNILALCDLSTSNAILEIKTDYKKNAFIYRNQLYYEANGRTCFLLQVDWTNSPDIVAIEIHQVHLSLGEKPHKPAHLSKIETVQKKVRNDNIEVIEYLGRNKKIKLKCRICEHEWDDTYYRVTNKPHCPVCTQLELPSKKERITDEERKKIRTTNYMVKLLQKSNGCIHARNYTGAKYDVDAQCLKCGYEWNTRADHLIDRAYCPRCKANKNKI